MQQLGDYEFITDQKSVDVILSDARRQKILGVDTENSGGLDIITEDLKLLLFQIEVNGRAYVIDARKVDISPFRELIEDGKYTKIVQNVIYDYKILKVLRDIVINGVYDPKIAESLLDAGISKDGHSLDSLSFKYLDFKMNKDIAKQFVNFPYDGEFTEDQIRYAADDVLVLPYIRKRQQIYLNQLSLNGIAEMEFALAIPTAKMELAGIRLDTYKWKEALTNLNKKVFKISNDLRQILPDPPAPPPKPVRLKKDGTPYANTAKPKPPPVLNLDSWQQLAKACSDVGIDFSRANKITKAGLTNNATMKLAAKMYSGEPDKAKIIKDIIKYRELRQTEKTFGENLIDFVRSDGRIHAKFNQNGTASGRYSSNEPNLQNIQKKGVEGRILRSCFIPADNHKFVLADYSQIELRIAAELSNDKKMIQILNDPRGDIHRGTASEMYGVSYDDVSGDLRSAAKTINFGLIYGMSAKTLSERLECSPEEADEHLNKYWKTYPTLMEWLNKTGIEAVESGYSKTIGGRIRWFPTVDSKDPERNKKIRFYERVGKNHPIQGTSADMTKVAIIYLDRTLDEYKSKIVNTVHDEVCVEVPFECAIDVAKLVKNKMILAGEKFLKKVPVLVDVNIRDCWFKDDGVEDDENGQQLWLLKLDL